MTSTHRRTRWYRKALMLALIYVGTSSASESRGMEASSLEDLTRVLQSENLQRVCEINFAERDSLSKKDYSNYLFTEATTEILHLAENNTWDVTELESRMLNRRGRYRRAYTANFPESVSPVIPSDVQKVFIRFGCRYQELYSNLSSFCDVDDRSYLLDEAPDELMVPLSQIRSGRRNRMIQNICENFVEYFYPLAYNLADYFMDVSLIDDTAPLTPADEDNAVDNQNINEENVFDTPDADEEQYIFDIPVGPDDGVDADDIDCDEECMQRQLDCQNNFALRESLTKDDYSTFILTEATTEIFNTAGENDWDVSELELFMLASDGSYKPTYKNNFPATVSAVIPRDMQSVFIRYGCRYQEMYANLTSFCDSDGRSDYLDEAPDEIMIPLAEVRTGRREAMVTNMCENFAEYFDQLSFGLAFYYTEMGLINENYDAGPDDEDQYIGDDLGNPDDNADDKSVQMQTDCESDYIARLSLTKDEYSTFLLTEATTEVLNTANGDKWDVSELANQILESDGSYKSSYANVFPTEVSPIIPEDMQSVFIRFSCRYYELYAADLASYCDGENKTKLLDDAPIELMLPLTDVRQNRRNNMIRIMCTKYVENYDNLTVGLANFYIEQGLIEENIEPELEDVNDTDTDGTEIGRDGDDIDGTNDVEVNGTVDEVDPRQLECQSELAEREGLTKDEYSAFLLTEATTQVFVIANQSGWDVSQLNNQILDANGDYKTLFAGAGSSIIPADLQSNFIRFGCRYYELYANLTTFCESENRTDVLDEAPDVLMIPFDAIRSGRRNSMIETMCIKYVENIDQLVLNTANYYMEQNLIKEISETESGEPEGNVGDDVNTPENMTEVGQDGTDLNETFQTDEEPTSGPSPGPTQAPTTKGPISESPTTSSPTTSSPTTTSPTTATPTTTSPTTASPTTASPTTASPTEAPTESPTRSPTKSPTTSPTISPSASPTKSPSASPVDSPSASPTRSPTKGPSPSPTQLPTNDSSLSPSIAPSQSPAEPVVDIVESGVVVDVDGGQEGTGGDSSEPIRVVDGIDEDTLSKENQVNQEGSNDKSKVIIIGSVVGGICALLFIGLLMFICRGRGSQTAKHQAMKLEEQDTDEEVLSRDDDSQFVDVAADHGQDANTHNSSNGNGDGDQLSELEGGDQHHGEVEEGHNLGIVGESEELKPNPKPLKIRTVELPATASDCDLFSSSTFKEKIEMVLATASDCELLSTSTSKEKIEMVLANTSEMEAQEQTSVPAWDIDAQPTDEVDATTEDNVVDSTTADDVADSKTANDVADSKTVDDVNYSKTADEVGDLTTADDESESDFMNPNHPEFSDFLRPSQVRNPAKPNYPLD